MKNYRIQKLIDGDFVRYYPQTKILGFFWVDMFAWAEYYDGFKSYEQAKKALCNTIKKPIVEYLEVDCNND